METTISAGAVFGTIAFVVFFLICAGIATLCLSFGIRDRDGELKVLGGFFAAAALVVTGVYIFSMWPFEAEYHHWTPTSGTIETVNKRIMTQDGAMQERYVVRFTNGNERACDDTRCSLLQAGDQLSLKCKREFQWVGTDGWSCNYVDSKRR